MSRALLPEAGPEHPGSFQAYVHPFDTPSETLIERFTQELEALAGRVYLLAEAEEVSETILTILRQHNAAKIISWNDEDLGLPWLRGALQAAGVEIIDEQLPANDNGRKTRLSEVEDVKVGLTGALAPPS